jgi:hypothetical protein
LRQRRQRVGALVAAATVAGSLTGVIATLATSGIASAVVPNLTFNDNACTTAAQPNSPSLIAIGLGADQSEAAIQNTVDALSGATVPGAGNKTVNDAGVTGTGLSPTHGVLQGSTGTLTNVTGQGFVSAAFLQAGVGLGLIHIGDTINATIDVTIHSGNSTFAASQPAGVTVVNSTTASLHGAGSGTVVGSGSTVTAPLAATISFPNVNYTVPNTPSGSAYFYEDSPTITFINTSGGATIPMPGDGQGLANDSAVYLVATLPIGPNTLGCAPGVPAPGTGNPPNTPWTPTAQGDVYVFADVAIQAAQAPTLVPQTVANVNLGGSAIIHALQGATGNVGVDPASVTVVTPPAHGTTTVNPVTGDITYQNDGTGGGGGDSFTVTAAAPAPNGSLVSVPVTETITNIVSNPSSCDVTVQPSCALKQIILVPVTGADLTMSQASGLPVDTLGATLVGVSCNGPAITLNGQPQFACGAMSPITVVNARGSDPGWTLSGQVSDFLDPAASPTMTCDTPATYNSHCIPGGNLSWDPVAAVGHAIVPGDTAQVAPGAPLLGGLAAVNPSLANAAALTDAIAQPNPALAAFGKQTQPNPVVEPSPVAGLHDGAQTLCSTLTGQSGGTFICGAGLIVAVPASAAAPASPGYQATLTLTLA